MNEVDILLIEDMSQDAELISEALIEACAGYNVKPCITVVPDGEEALSFLKGQPNPHLVFLDLNIPKVSGREVLKVIRDDPMLRTIPIIILTNSNSQDDIDECYGLHCNAYIRKPLGFDNIIEVMGATSHFWFRQATLPRPLRHQHPTSIPPSKP